ncbi:MAG: hypothetical protein J7K15_10175 [Deltaproteobacteria bacterium]|nr:hypothetical protein [Deltaproteobacteria bacterium]
MRLYLEIMELLSEEEMFTRQPQFIRVEVRDEDQAMQLYQQLKPLFAGRKYVARLHYCYHEEGKPCEVKIIEEVE